MLVKWPVTYKKLAIAGYRYACRDKICACGKEAQWFSTPFGTRILLSQRGDGLAAPHNCSEVRNGLPSSQQECSRTFSTKNPRLIERIAMERPSRVLIASSEPETKQRVMRILDRLGVDCVVVSTIGQCCRVLVRENVALVFCDRNLGDGGYRDLLVAVNCKSGISARVILMTSQINPREYHAAKQAGLFEAITSPCRPTDVQWMVILAKRAERMRIKQLVTLRLEMVQTTGN
jgi:PleD family two-component response regulator